MAVARFEPMALRTGHADTTVGVVLTPDRARKMAVVLSQYAWRLSGLAGTRALIVFHPGWWS
jgi:hypothetical protein